MNVVPSLRCIPAKKGFYQRFKDDASLKAGETVNVSLNFSDRKIDPFLFAPRQYLETSDK